MKKLAMLQEAEGILSVGTLRTIEGRVLLSIHCDPWDWTQDVKPVIQVVGGKTNIFNRTYIMTKKMMTVCMDGDMCKNIE